MVRNTLVDESQAAFVPGRGLMDNILLSHELIKGWIMECIKTVSYSININGSPTIPFDARRGMGQGDPMSPLLFVLAMDYLTRSLKSLKDQPNYNYHPRCEKPSLIQLSFADDLLLLCRGDKAWWQTRTRATYILEEFQGQYNRRLLKLQGSAQTNAGENKTVDNEVSELCRKTSIDQECTHSIQSFWSQIFPLPKKVIQQVEAMCRKFLWTGDTGSSKKALVAWNKLCRPKTKGGLNVTDLNTWK
ncbi:PREDICTED: uncharacterized protein LOC109243825 [Nicotiana attenuata]|uniref:uncharacterized protein LOC109243825 n=1 Tax=Nicotiana attenuata TaxID=49451 RepID=UPI00090499ED|nr:PREDICTED: uncharacterized protein LOC109243825 [Nicotiana attenuata]